MRLHLTPGLWEVAPFLVAAFLEGVSPLIEKKQDRDIENVATRGMKEDLGALITIYMRENPESVDGAQGAMMGTDERARQYVRKALSFTQA